MLSLLIGTIISITPGCEQPTPGAQLTGTFEADTVHLTATGGVPSEFGLFIYGTPLTEPVPFYNGRLCCSWNPYVHTVPAVSDSTGTAECITNLPGSSATRLSVQYMYRVPGQGFGGDLSNGLIVERE